MATSKEEGKTMTKNTIFTDAEYMAQGFRADEVADVRRSDILFNKWIDNGGWLPEDQNKEYDTLIIKLGL